MRSQTIPQKLDARMRLPAYWDAGVIQGCRSTQKYDCGGEITENKNLAIT
jgi:hypothetical protein